MNLRRGKSCAFFGVRLLPRTFFILKGEKEMKKKLTALLGKEVSL